MKIIFLDLDGVLNSCASTARHGKSILAPEHIEVLNIITEVTGAQIVISSAWRLDLTLAQLKWMLRRKKVKAKIIGMTPDLSEVHRDYDSLFSARERGHEIQAWLNEHPCDQFIILDDGDDMAHLKSHLIQTDCQTGLTPEHAKEAIRRLS